MHFFLIGKANIFSSDININVHYIPVLDHVTDLGICIKSEISFSCHFMILLLELFRALLLYIKILLSLQL